MNAKNVKRPTRVQFKKVRLSKDAIFQAIGGEGVILDLKSASYFGLDEVGARFWQHITENGDLDDVASLLLSEFEVDPERLERDLTKLVEQLKNAGLVEVE